MLSKNHVKKLHHCDGAFFNPISFKLSDKIVRKLIDSIRENEDTLRVERNLFEQVCALEICFDA